MSIIHVNQIKNRIKLLFADKLDLSDLKNHKDLENFLVTRCLAAYAIYYLSGAEPSDCASSVVDSGDDNGIDAIYYDNIKKVLFVVQSKWIHDGTGEPKNGDIKKFVAGVRDLFNLSLERFNPRIQAKQNQIEKALQDPDTTYQIAVVYTGIHELSVLSRRDLKDLEDEMNDASDMVSTDVLNQTELYKSLASGVSGEPINLQLSLKSWGKTESPHTAFYGQINGTEVASWHRYRARLFDKNLRNSLGDTDVNTEIRNTIESEPKNFWYFNNGITIIAKKISKTMVGGADREHGTFHCEDVSIVNGAQTVSAIGKYAQNNQNQNIDHIYVPIRVIELGEDKEFGNQVTKANNRQNKIENRDFVRQDPEQIRIQTELAIEKVEYILMRSDSSSLNNEAFDLIDSTTALACASGQVQLVVQVKREIGKIWENLEKGPYKLLFNASVSGMYVWRCVRIQKMIDISLTKTPGILGLNSARDKGIATHGNRIIAALAFKTFKLSIIRDPSVDFENCFNQGIIDTATTNAYIVLKKEIDSKYPTAILPTLFKNLSKCKTLLK